jgi:cell wall-associated NlpC family hydrolase
MPRTITTPRRGRVLTSAATVVLALTAGLLGPTSAAAASLAGKRAEAARIANQVQAYDMKLEAVVQQYDAAVGDLTAVRGRITANTRMLALARDNLTASRARLAAALVSNYKGSGSDDTAYVLAAGSFTDLVNRMEYVDRVGSAQADLLRQVSDAEKDVRARQRALRTDERRAVRLVSARARSRDAVQAALRHRQAMLAGVKQDIRRLIAAQQAAQARAAAAAAAAAERRAAQQAPTGPVASFAQAAATGASGAGGSPAGGEAIPAPPSNGTLGQQAVAVAMRYLGARYVWGGASPSGFDCSGLTMYAYAQVGVSLGHFTGAQWGAGPHVPRGDLQPGDLVFFAGLSHVGMYVGGGSFIHAPHTGDVVKISSLGSGWYASSYDGAVRPG